MGSIHNPYGSGPRDPLEKPFHVERIDEEEQTKRDNPKGAEAGSAPQDKLGIAAYLLLMFQKMVDFFSQGTAAKSAAKTAQSNLLELKKFFDILKDEDRSEDIKFLNRLSTIWHFVLEDAIHFKGESQASLHFKQLIKIIQHYPENQEHSLGYYLFEYAGQQWIPFPYMDLIAKIHSEHEKNPLSSPLVVWTRTIDELIVLLKSERF